jgi:hypothetical protein
MEDWLNRIGLTLQFVALFLVTPEILGEKKVDSLSELWKKPLGWIEKHLTRNVIVLIGTLLLLAGIRIYTQVVPPRSAQHRFLGSVWGLFAFVLCLGIVVWIIQYLLSWVPRIAGYIANRSKGFFAVGAFIFTIGFALLMWATFVPAA